MATETKHPLKSKTIIFGLVSILVGAVAAVMSFLDAQDIVPAQTGVWSAVMGAITIFLRYKTTIAVALKIDDPTTPEDESKGERAAGFAIVRVLAFLAAIGLILTMLTGCAGLTVREQKIVDGSIVCGSELLGTGLRCVPLCLGEATQPEREACAINCTVNAVEVTAPVCLEAYGDLYSAKLRAAIRVAVEAAFEIYRASK